MKSWHIALLLIAGMLASGWGGYNLSKTELVYVDVVSVRTDTLWLQPTPVIHYVQLPAKHDTTIIRVPARPDTVYRFADRYSAYVDTDLTHGTTNYGKLSVSYYFPPWDTFDVQFKPAPMPTYITTKVVQTPVPWHRNRFLWLAAGIATGAAIVEATR